MQVVVSHARTQDHNRFNSSLRSLYKTPTKPADGSAAASSEAAQPALAPLGSSSDLSASSASAMQNGDGKQQQQPQLQLQQPQPGQFSQQLPAKVKARDIRVNRKQARNAKRSGVGSGAGPSAADFAGLGGGGDNVGSEPIRSPSQSVLSAVRSQPTGGRKSRTRLSSSRTLAASTRSCKTCAKWFALRPAASLCVHAAGTPNFAD